jgi:predicted SprT family Zn-dependent metalloprotease
MTDANNLSDDTSLESKKKGRKPKKEKIYFGERQELAVKDFLIADSFEEKNKIYNDFLRHPIDKMISSIIRTYKLYRKDVEFEEIHNDTHSFLMTKIEKFKPSKEKKAYSYFGTICKNYLMGQILKDQKETNRKVSYEDISSALENRPDMVYYLEFEKIDAEKIIDKFLIDLKDYVMNSQLQENESKLGYALIELFDDYGNIFIGNDNNKFNKNIVLLTLREMTNLNTKEIRTYLKKYKSLYLETLKKIHNQ